MVFDIRKVFNREHIVSGDDIGKHRDISTKNLTVAEKATIDRLEVERELLPRDDNTVDIGSGTKEIKNIYIDGTAFMDIAFHEGGVYDFNIVTKTGSYTITMTDHIILLNSSAGAFTITLPAAIGVKGMVLVFKKVDVSINAITIDGNASETIDGALTNVDMDAQYDTLTIICDGSNWHIIGRWIH